MQITVVHEVWDNNSICLDVYGKFIYMAQFSANFPVKNDKYLVPLPFFQKYFIVIVKTSTLFCYHCLAKGNKDSICVYMLKKGLIVCGFFLPSTNGRCHKHHCIIQRFLLLNNSIHVLGPD